MSNIDDGGDAFPRSDDQDPGMSLRDWFAGQALPAAYADELQRFTEGDKDYFDVGEVVDNAYNVADAMLRARKEAK